MRNSYAFNNVSYCSDHVLRGAMRNFEVTLLGRNYFEEAVIDGNVILKLIESKAFCWCVRCGWRRSSDPFRVQFRSQGKCFTKFVSTLIIISVETNYS